MEDLTEATAGSNGYSAGSRQRFDYLLEDIEFLFHEIRTPLTVIINYSEFLRDQTLPVVKQRQLLDNIRKEALRIDTLLNDFSETYHHAAGTWLTETAFSTINVGDLLREASARFLNASARHTLRVEAPANLPSIRGDWEKLYLMLRNLLANAIKYSPDGGEVFVSAVEDNQEVIIRVRDQGIGIPEECLQTIFNRGFRVKLSGCNTSRGSGLGLTMVKRIVEGHNGNIRVESTPGKGSTFILALPIPR